MPKGRRETDEWQGDSGAVRMPWTYYIKAYFALWFLTCRNPRKISTIQSESMATIRPTGYVYAYPKCALAKAEVHDGCIVHIGVGLLVVARL